MLSQCNARNIQAAFPGESEQPQYCATQTVFPVCSVSCSHTTGCDAYSFTADGYGIFNVRTNVGACGTHEGRWGEGVRHKEVCTSVNSEGQKHCPSPCRSARGLNPGSSDLKSDSLTTEPRPPVLGLKELRPFRENASHNYMMGG